VIRHAVKISARGSLVVAAVLLAAAPDATAARDATVTRTHNGVTCTWRGALGGLAACRRSDRVGYVVIVSQRLVMVETASAKVRFWRTHPSVSVGHAALNDRRVTVTETHDRITCSWTARDGGGAFCTKANRRGYVAGLTRHRVWAADEGSNLVYLVLQP
jgi:hypothetical protein